MINIEEIEFELLSWYDNNYKTIEKKFYPHRISKNWELSYMMQELDNTPYKMIVNVFWIFLDKLMYFLDDEMLSLSITTGKQFDIEFYQGEDDYGDNSILIDLAYYFSDVVKHGVMYK